MISFIIACIMQILTILVYTFYKENNILISFVYFIALIVFVYITVHSFALFFYCKTKKITTIIIFNFRKYTLNFFFVKNIFFLLFKVVIKLWIRQLGLIYIMTEVQRHHINNIKFKFEINVTVCQLCNQRK